MTTIEERVVSMKFEGNQFLSGVDQSMSKLDKLNERLRMQEGTKGLDALGAAAGRQSSALSHLADGVQHISDRFKTLSVVGVAALSTITSKAVTAGGQLIKSLSIDPIMDGFHEYETNMNSIQTILANTQAAGTKLSDVTHELDNLNHYADKTIYSFSEMAKNIGTFTAAGVGLKESTTAIKGIANLAAMSGANAEKTSGVMYQLSQAISSGRVSLEDWMSVVNAGMAGSVFQRALVNNAVAMGDLNKSAVALEGPMKNVTVAGQSFHDSIMAKPGKKSWLTSKVLTQTLQQFSGDLSYAQIKAQGFTDAQTKAILAQAKVAQQSATEVKTLTQLYGTLKESVGSGWAQTFKLIFGDFNEAKGLFTGVNNALSAILNKSSNTRNQVVSDWSKAGGRAALIDALNNSFEALLAILKPIKQAWAQAFPAKSGFQLAEITKNIAKFTASLKISGSTADLLKRTFAGFFSILGLGWDVLKQVVSLILRLVGVATEGTGGFLKFTATLGDFFVNLRASADKGKVLENVFKRIGDVLVVPIQAIRTFIGYVAKLVTGLDFSKVGKAFDHLTDSIHPLSAAGASVSGVWGHLTDIFDVVMTKLTKISPFFEQLSKNIMDAFQNLKFDDILHGINTGLLAGLFLTIKKFLGGLRGGGDEGGGILDSIKDSFEGLTDALKTMQNVLKANILLQIAAAVGILAVSMNILAKIDSGGLTRASIAMGVMFGQLIGSMLLFEKFSGFTGFAKMPFIAASMILMAAAVTILASAMSKMAELDWNGILKGLTGVTALIGIMVAAFTFMPNPKGIILSAAGMVIMAAAIKILAGAVTQLSGLSWPEMIQGLVGVGALIGALVVFANQSNLNIKGFISGVVVLMMAGAIQTLATALKNISGLSLKEMAQGLGTLAVGLELIARALGTIPPSSLMNAAAVIVVAASLQLINKALATAGGMSWIEIAKGLLVLAVSLNVIAEALFAMEGTLPGAAALGVASLAITVLGLALKSMGDMSWEAIAKSMVVLAGSLVILSVAMIAMEGALPGAAALLVVTAALALFTPILITLGSLSWGTILTGLGALAILFTILGVAGLLIAPAVPGLLGLATAILAIGAAVLVAGAGIALFGAGIALLGVGLTALAASGVAAAAAFVGMLSVLLGAIPAIVKFIGDLLVALANMVIQVAPKLGEAFTALLNMIIDTFDRLVPKIIDVFLHLLSSLNDSLLKYVPHMIDSASRLIIGVLNGLSQHADAIATAGTTLVVRFMNGISKNLPRVIQAGINMIINFINGLANAIRSNTDRMNAAGRNLASAIIDGMVKGLASGASVIADMARSVAKGALDAAKNILGIHSPSKEFEKLGNYVNDGFRKGLKGNKKQVDDSFDDLRKMVSNLFTSSAKDVVSLSTKLDKLTSARHKDKKAIKETSAALAQAEKEQGRAIATSVYMAKSLQTQHATLDRLATQYESVTTRLKAANDALTDAIKTRDDYNKTIKDQYSNIAAPAADTTAADYVTNLKKQVEDTKSFSNELQQLRKLGLNDQTYQDLLQAGIADLPFVTDLLKGGKSQVNQINDLNKQLGSVATSMGKTASSQLYQAAVDSAAGIVKGLQNQQKAIQNQMNQIADGMVKAIKSRLGIKSPSRVFAEVGKFSAEGLANGLAQNSTLVNDSAETLAKNAVASLQKSLLSVDKMVAGNINVQPTITPVLDLTDVKKNAGKLNGLIPTTGKMVVSSAYSQAANVANAIDSQRMSAGDSASVAAGAVLSYTQNNYSPKTLSAADIYRTTKNQLSTVKGALST